MRSRSRRDPDEEFLRHPPGDSSDDDADDQDTEPEDAEDAGEGNPPLPCDKCLSPTYDKGQGTPGSRTICRWCAPGTVKHDEDGKPTVYSPDPTDPFPCENPGCGRKGLDFNDVRLICDPCADRIARAAPPTDLRKIREQALGPREARRRIAKNLCADLCGRPHTARSPRCKECLRIHRRELARRRQLKMRRRLRDARPEIRDNRSAPASTRPGAPVRSGEGSAETQVGDAVVAPRSPNQSLAPKRKPRLNPKVA
jgi:hypothetical protein